MRIVVVNLKGGTGKTTSAVYLACVLATSGPVVLVDTDPQGSATSWAEGAEDLPFATVSVPNASVARQGRDLARRYEHLVIDTPPGHPAITAAALGVGEVALVPVTTGSVDLVRFGATVELIEAARGSNPGLAAYAVLTKTRASTRSRRDVRAALEEAGLLPVLATEIPLREAIGSAEGTTPSPADVAVYEALVRELPQKASR